ncbi:MAG TPA: hypothetical protein VGN14_18290 [Candidatus Elarobacter sp.]|jgi:hypothetical protein
MSGERAAAFAAVVVLAACITGYGASERRIGELGAANEAAASALAADAAALAARPALLASATRLRAALVSAPRGGGAAAFLRDAARAAGARRTTIALIAAATKPSTFTLGLEGRYADVLATIRSLSRLQVPAALTVSALTRTSAAGSATVAATLQVELGPQDATRPR